MRLENRACVPARNPDAGGTYSHSAMIDYPRHDSGIASWKIS